MGILEKLFNKPSSEAAERPRWSVSAVGELLRHFPVGCRILYSPESKKELRLESVVLGCSVNRRFVYSQGQIRLEGSGAGAVLVVSGEDGEIRFPDVQSFYYLIPHQNRSEIDYRPEGGDRQAARLVEKNVNDFERNSVLTLTSFSPYGRVPHLEAAVKSTSVLRSGFYANHKVVVLDPFFNSLAHADKRKHHRVSTKIPLVLLLGPKAAPIPCVMEDFAERFVRVHLGEASDAEIQLAPGQAAVLTLELPDGSRTFTLRACVHRQNRRAVVLELKAVLKEGRFRELHLVDQLDLKATLLNHPATQEVLREGSSRH